MNEHFKLATFAGGCFWCTEAVFLRLKGVIKVVSGYTGGHIKNPAYREICTGRTGHAEAIQITFDETVISFTELLEVFFATHNPTTLNRQGNDVGTQYRSAVFYKDESQKTEAEKFIKLLEKENIFEQSIVTEVTALETFYLAEDEHQNYYDLNKEQSYCQYVIQPKIEKLMRYYKPKLK
ncbi:MAG: peptide-methionine (S)-S-oxide reductase MsrA [Flavobacteriales bacterium]|nr:peptide-methionine (S)-S-oxide reductase MsrA [Flavobacteriia bacterium]NCP06380.1 peptide-methionine (S)-S-oxide reductase MsrA [Flavobacteriales bacterium]PIV94689.1 MAG: peptide-methionine (S)-S-oxide reductase [Flavobacteriaceae bacterium CG17_big_fil_post_rev_8_21_14_2_50_33_15]PIY10861.1 MAG: peptide-methionine (S)-S-oxide reductase [Flavobacteriaceae bacterium CG_4_10_14_3_um_filter_33_47]PJB20562.1 MAG: peptide-methionine (S)-S-oxide reductase [Flavobacteriaceae bacterium CG_4_9_14_3